MQKALRLFVLLFELQAELHFFGGRVEHQFYLKEQLKDKLVIQAWEFGRYFLKHEVNLLTQGKN